MLTLVHQPLILLYKTIYQILNLIYFFFTFIPQKYKNKAFIRKQFSTFNKREILDGFKECFRNEDDLSSVSKTGVWGRLLQYIGKPPTRVAILVFKRWCMKNNILEEQGNDEISQ